MIAGLQLAAISMQGHKDASNLRLFEAQVPCEGLICPSSGITRHVQNTGDCPFFFAPQQSVESHLEAEW